MNIDEAIEVLTLLKKEIGGDADLVMREFDQGFDVSLIVHEFINSDGLLSTESSEDEKSVPVAVFYVD